MDEEQSETLLQREEAATHSSSKVEEYLGGAGHAQSAPGDFAHVLWLSATLFSIIGGFWLLDSLKDTVLEVTLGMEYQPRAKLSSVLVTLLLVVGYNRLVDTVHKHVLFYWIGGCYMLALLVIGFLLLAIEGGALQGLRHVAGWASYVVIESYGSLVVAQFWAFVNASVSLDEAKATYGWIIAGGQAGAIVGSTVATMAVPIPHLYLMGATTPAVMAALVWGFIGQFPSLASGKRGGSSDRGSKPGEMEGLRLVLRHRYVTMLLLVSCLNEVVLTVLDYQMKLAGVAHVRRERFAALMGHFGQVTNCISLLLSLFGTRYAVSRLGVAHALRIFPVLLISAVVASRLYPSLGVLFSSVALLKGLTYALNEPCKEMLYMVTSDAVKFKAKGWIDVFGSRCAKGVGSFISEGVRSSPNGFLNYGSPVLLLVSMALLGVSFLIGDSFDRLLQRGEIVGREEERRSSPTQVEL
ncbi:unnamed protein product [Chrysoparadoxa australica]